MKLWLKDLISLIFESRCLGVLFGGVAQGHDDDDDGDDGDDDDYYDDDGDCYWFLCVCSKNIYKYTFIDTRA